MKKSKAKIELHPIIKLFIKSNKLFTLNELNLDLINFSRYNILLYHRIPFINKAINLTTIIILISVFSINLSTHPIA